MSKVIDMIEDYYTREHYALEDIADDLEEVIEYLQEALKELRLSQKEGE